MLVEQGSIYWADLDPVVGREQRGRRPVLVISKDAINRLPLTVLVMAGSKALHYQSDSPFPSDLFVTAQETGMPLDTVFLGLQLRSIDQSRLGEKIGHLPQSRMAEVWEILSYVTGAPR